MFDRILSAARLQANRENAQKSTGPTTEAGKLASSQNSTSHGLTAATPVIEPGEEPVWQALHASYLPQGPLEDDLFRRLVLASWNLRRIEKLEARLAAQSAGDPLESADPEIQEKLLRYSRHKSQNERTFHRCLKELRESQNHRAAAQQLAANLPAATPPLANPETVSRRSTTLKDTITEALIHRTNQQYTEASGDANAETSTPAHSTAAA